MSTYLKILNEFKRLGFNEESSLQEHEINRALDSIHSKNTGNSEFDRDVAEQLWEHSSKDSSRTVQLRYYINTIIEAENILRQQAGILEENISRENEPTQKQTFRQELDGVIQDHKLISSTFALPSLQGSYRQLSNSVPIKAGSQPSQAVGNDSGIFSFDPNAREESSTDLKIALILSVIILLWEIVLIFHKHHFFNLLIMLFVLAIYFLNYFDRNYIKFILIGLGSSVLLDILWLIVMAKHFWESVAETQHSTLHTGFLQFSVVLCIILMVARLVLVGIFWKYRENAESFRKNVHIFGNKFKLDGNPAYNLFTTLFGGQLYNSQYS